MHRQRQAAQALWVRLQGRGGHHQRGALWAASSISAPCTATPYDGHTLKDTVAGVEAITGPEPERTFVDKGYRRHDFERVSRLEPQPRAKPVSHRRLTYFDPSTHVY